VYQAQQHTTTTSKNTSAQPPLETIQLKKRNNQKKKEKVMHGTTKKANLRTMFLNIQSLRHKTIQLEIKANDIQPDIICLSEHWLVEDETNSTTIEGYEIGNVYCRSKQKNGGVIIYFKSGRAVKPYSIIDRLGVEVHAECTAIELEETNRNTIVVNMYRALSGNREIFMETIAKILGVVSMKKGRTIIGGDINIDIISGGSTRNRLFDLLSANGFSSNIKEPTRITRTSQTCIDNVFTNGNNDNISAEVIDLGLSDHCAIVVNHYEQEEQPATQNKYINKRFFSDLNKKEFNNILSEIKWDEALKTGPIDEMMKNFLDIFLECFNTSFPKKMRKRGRLNKEPLGVEWYTADLKKLG
jgi:Endonuclease-reverse transcriptase